MLSTTWSARALGTAALAVLLAHGPAAADTKVLDDPVGDATSVDVSQVRVVHRNAVTVRVRSALPLAAGQVYVFWIDSGAGPRPDHRVAFRANSDFDDALGVVRSFGGGRSGSVPCPGMRARADIFTAAPVSLRIPRRCLDDPRRIRVAVQFKDQTAGSADWSADRRTFGPWVRR